MEGNEGEGAPLLFMLGGGKGHRHRLKGKKLNRAVPVRPLTPLTHLSSKPAAGDGQERGRERDLPDVWTIPAVADCVVV